MSFARSPYGTTPYGGSALISGGFALVSASPIPNGTGVSIAAPVQFQVNASAEFDDLSLKVQLNGVQVILNSEFLVSFGGTIVFDGPDLIVTISSHPAFADGNPVTVDIEIVDLHGDLQTVSYLFNVDEAAFAGAETLTLLETLSIGFQVEVGETLTFVEGMSPFVAIAVDTLLLSEGGTQAYNANPSTVEVLSLDEGLQVGALNFVSVDGLTVSVDFPEEMDLDEASDVNRYSVTANEAEAYPVTINTVELVIETLQTGTTGQVVETNPGTFHSRVFDTVIGSFLPSQVGQYLYITGSPGTSFAFEPGEPYRVIDFDGSKVTVDRDLPGNDPSNGTYVPGSGYTPGTGLLQWKFTRGATGALLHTTKSTNGKVYVGAVIRLKTIHGSFLSGQRVFTANASKPQVVSVQFFPEDGTLLVSFDELMRIDEALLSVGEYSFTGPTPVAIRSVRALDERTVALETVGFSSGNYTLIVNATGTPKDAAGNPIDPIFNMAIFSAATPLVSRSVFTDKGPIVKPPLTIQTGVDGEIQTYTTSAFGATQFTSNDVVLPGGSFTSSHVGLRIELGGTTLNSGSFLITGQVNATRLRLQASFSLPDPNNGSMTWKLVDPRTGEIADDPADVVVKINNTITAVQAVVGLLGQVVLPVAPAPTDDVKVDYSWIKDPTIEFRRLNSKEFRLNNWNNDVGRQNPTQHAYRYRNVTIQPATFMPDDIRADLIQPLFRELHYRAFERAYSVALNDPNLLVLNTPIHKIAYPPLSRSIESTSVSYTADVLPENDLVPWERKGLGIASVGSGLLTVQSNTPGPFPTGNPLFWSRSVDLTFPHVFAATWRMEINSTTPNGIFTGVAVGWSNDRRAIVMGYLLDGGVRKLGFLKKGFGNDPSTLSAWVGGILPSNDPSGLPFNFDWSISHSYRFFRGRDEIVRLFVDGEVVESLRVLEEDLPYLEELGDPFDQLQGIFFGSLDRQAESLSTWDVVRYLVLPTNPSQTAPSIFASYEGDLLPENSPAPWTLVGYHGTESLLGGSLILDSTSATTQATSEEVGLVGGDFRGFTRIEPLLLVSADVVLDVNVQLRTFTHGITPNAVMAAVDDGSRLIQLCFFPTQSQPKVSYPGRSLPEDATPSPWGALGSATARMVGRTLRIEDDTLLDGLVYFIEDLAPMASPDRIIEALIDYFAEFRFQVVSFLNDGTPVGFCGATVDVFDGTRSIGVMLRESVGVPQVAFHSDGTLLGIGSQFNFNWNDGLTHTYRITKSTGGDLVTLFIDNTLIGTYPYSSFLVSGGNPTISFGSATAGSVSSTSVVDWIYVNVWRAQPTSGVRKYVGIWKGTDPTSLTGYYFQLKTSGHAALAGNVLTDLSANFVAAGVAVGGDLVIDIGPNKGVYSIATVAPTVLTILSTFPFTPSEADYRIPTETDWTVAHKYRLVRDPGGSVSLLLDAIPSPVIRLDYSEVVLPASSLGISSIINQGLASITWGAFDPTNISQTSWDFVRYGITRSPTEIRIVPHHQFLNQRNVMSSPEHLFTTVAHNHTQFSSSSTGIPYPWEEFAENPAVIAFTRLNEGTPLVPSTQTYEVRRPSPVFEFVSGLNRPEDVLNNDGDFVTNDATLRVRLLVPKDVLYNDLKIIEQSTGEAEHIAPFSDEYNPIALKKLNWTKDVCAVYSGDVLPENDPDFKTQWVLESDDPGQVTATAFAGVLTYSTLASPTNTIYRNPTPLTDPAGLQTTVSFKLKLLNDATSGTGDTGVRFGFNAFGLTAALAFVSTPLGDREVRLLDLLSNTTLGAIPFDFLDGSYHVYSLVKNVGNGTLDFLIDP